MLITYSLSWVTIALSDILPVFRNLLTAAHVWLTSDRQMQNTISDRFNAKVVITMLAGCFLGVLILVFTIAGAEKIIDYNGLTPETDVSKSSQILPLMLGIFGVCDGIAVLLRPAPASAQQAEIATQVETVPQVPETEAEV
jgi:hypothetical protein